MNNVLSTRVTIFRNIKDFKFVPKLEVEQKQQILDMVEKAVHGKMALVNVANLDGEVSKNLIANDLLFANTQDLFLSKENLTINMFNGEHLAIASACMGFNKEVVTKAVNISQTLSNKINFAFSDEYGYLMSDLNKIGSGIRIESNIMLSAITSINKIEQVRQNVAKLGYSLNETKFPAVYTLSTRCNLGIGEKKLFEDFESTLVKLQDLETESVKMLDVANHNEMLDKTSRSIAILNSAYLLNYDELYNIIVNLRMGVNLGITNLKIETLNKLQSLVYGKINDIATQDEFVELAKKAKEILKGEQNV
jgi:protein arginine kinase